mmetsp:Transcript_63650/g.138634  ORF Transcript_63650/g.138634 Transcript_63650/m.138634 type:complete len:307 (-) Transcript_63650:483-1403(-)
MAQMPEHVAELHCGHLPAVIVVETRESGLELSQLGLGEALRLSKNVHEVDELIEVQLPRGIVFTQLVRIFHHFVDGAAGESVPQTSDHGAELRDIDVAAAVSVSFCELLAVRFELGFPEASRPDQNLVEREQRDCLIVLAMPALASEHLLAELPSGLHRPRPEEVHQHAGQLTSRKGRHPLLGGTEGSARAGCTISSWPIASLGEHGLAELRHLLASETLGEPVDDQEMNQLLEVKGAVLVGINNIEGLRDHCAERCEAQGRHEVAYLGHRELPILVFVKSVEDVKELLQLEPGELPRKRHELLKV